VGSALAVARIQLPCSRYVEYRGADLSPRHRKWVVVIVAVDVAGRHVVSLSRPDNFAADSELLVESEGLARDALEWQFARVVEDWWGVHMRRLAVG
jgi:hypothetical protein